MHSVNSAGNVDCQQRELKKDFSNFFIIIITLICIFSFRGFMRQQW